MGLTDQLNAAVDAPPPPGYDMNQLLRRGRRARTRRRVATGAAGLGTVALVAGTYVVAAQAGPDEHGGRAGAVATTTTPAATVSPPHPVTTSPAPADRAATIARLNATLRKLPASFGVPHGTGFAFHHDISFPFGYYNASWTHAGVRYAVQVNFTRDPLPSADSCGQPPTASCTPLFRPDVHAFLIEDRRQRFTIAVGSRADGTVVQISAYRNGSGPLIDTHLLFQGTVLPGFAVTP